MYPIKVLARGSFGPEDLLITRSSSNRRIDPIVEGQLDTLWEQKVRDAERTGKNLYNGISYRLNTLSEKRGKLAIDFGTFDYKTRDGLPDAQGYFALSDEYLRKGCYSIATIRTSDNRYLIVELSGKSMNPNKTELIGGIMELPIELQTGRDVFECFYVEMQEEAMIEKRDIEEIFLKMVYLTPTGNCGFYYEVILHTSANELLHRFAHASKDADIKRLMSYSRSEYLGLLKAHTETKKFLATVVEI